MTPKSKFMKVTATYTSSFVIVVPEDFHEQDTRLLTSYEEAVMDAEALEYQGSEMREVEFRHVTKRVIAPENDELKEVHTWKHKIREAAYNAEEELRCRRCHTFMVPGKVIEQTYVGGIEDFPGSKDMAGQTMSAGGSCKLVPCIKCPKCGHSYLTHKIK